MSRSSKVSFLTIDRMSIHGWIGWSMEGHGWSDSYFSSLNFLAFSGHFEELWFWSFVRSFFVNCLWYSHIWPVSDISFPEVFLSTRVCVFLVFFTKYLDMYFRNRISSFSRLSSRVIFEYASLFVKSVSGVCCVDVCYCAGIKQKWKVFESNRGFTVGFWRIYSTLNIFLASVSFGVRREGNRFCVASAWDAQLRLLDFPQPSLFESVWAAYFSP